MCNKDITSTLLLRGILRIEIIHVKLLTIVMDM